ncbi:hypothetical protein [Mucilaginibacter gynuensis]|uniref:hypothetical protein n=1 Tax=Mucilaginibacter gynuensis TaxID=1302236 RepID=UPI0031EBE8CA
MKTYHAGLIVCLMLLLNSCSVIGGIFKAGAVTGIIVVIVVIALILWLVSAFRK